MEFVGILRVLWRFRVLVVLSVIPAVAIAFVLGHARYTVGAGTAAALVDTQRSQTVDLGAQTGADIQTLVARATLLSSVMTSSPIKDEIALGAGILPSRLVSPPSATTGPGAVQQVATSRTATTISASVPQLQSGGVPIIVVTTQAPTAALAQRIADASFAQLIAGLGTVAGNDRVSKADRLVIRRLGTATSATVQEGPSMTAVVAAAIAVFVAVCLLILGVNALVTGWRRAAALERVELEAGDGPDEVEPEPTDGDAPDPNQPALFDHGAPPSNTSGHVAIPEPARPDIDERLAGSTKRRRKLGTVRS